MGIRLITALSLLALGLASGCEKKAESPAQQASAAFAVLEQQPVKAQIVTDQPGRVGVLFVMQDGWHIYAEEPGDAGMPTTVEWQAPPGVVLGPLTWPEPQHFVDPGNIKTNGYTGRVVLTSPVTVDPSAGLVSGAAVPVKARVRWLACKEICIPGSADLEAMVSVL